MTGRREANLYLRNNSLLNVGSTGNDSGSFGADTFTWLPEPFDTYLIAANSHWKGSGILSNRELKNDVDIKMLYLVRLSTGFLLGPFFTN